MNSIDFVKNFKKINKKNPQGTSNYEDNFLSDDDCNKSVLDSELDSDSDDDSGNFNSEEYNNYTESETDVSSICSDVDEEIIKVKKKNKSKQEQVNTFKLLQEESDFEEES